MTPDEVEQGARGSFTIDAAYLRGQARIALRTFFAPLAGVAAAFRMDAV